MNIAAAKKLIGALTKRGIREFCLCAGARNSPLVAVLGKASGIKIYHFFEERSAAFFALGRYQKSGAPVAVVTTSGTAVAELLPATIEAFYSGWPLALVTADRPASYRGTASPQTIEQVGIFGSYVEDVLDFSAEQFLENPKWERAVLDWSGLKPLHLNICLDEPLLDQACEPWAAQAAEFNVQTVETDLHGIPTLDAPLVLVGALLAKEVPAVEAFLSQSRLPIYAESHSQLCGLRSLSSQILKGGEKTVQTLFDKKICKSVIRIGGVPTLRLWRDLETKRRQLPVVSISRTGFSGLSRDSISLQGLRHLQNVNHFAPDQNFVRDEDLKSEMQIAQLCEKYPRSEQALIRDLSKKIADKPIYLGNSLPIREWDLFADKSKFAAEVYAHRGANGIDGQVSGYLGVSEGCEESWCVLGDLTALYDLSAPWITGQLSPGRRRLVVINNFGGQIFNSIFKDDIFLNRHALRFAGFAELWGWQYLKVERISDLPMEISNHVVMELCPDEQQSQSLWTELQK